MGRAPWPSCRELSPSDCDKALQAQSLPGLLDYGRPEGQEGFGPEGLCRNHEGLSSLQEGQGALPMNMHKHAKASAQGVGMSTPLERRCVGWTVSLVLSTIDE